MAAPAYSAETPGNVFNIVPLVAGGKNLAVRVDLSTVLGGALHCQMPTAATMVRCFRVSGATAMAPNPTLSGPVVAGATSVSATSAAGIKGQQIAIVAAGLTGELVTVSSVSGTTLSPRPA
jgi:hypothetical protein